jgi:hypothetical protein
MPVSLQELKVTIKREFQGIPELMVNKAVYGMKNRVAKLIEGKALRGLIFTILKSLFIV